MEMCYGIRLDAEGYFKKKTESSSKRIAEMNGILVESLPPNENQAFWPAYKLINNEWIFDEEKARIIQERINKQEAIEQINLEMEEIQAKLNNTDYKALKWMEGLLSDEEYNPIKEERMSLRRRYNELEEEIKKIEGGIQSGNN